MFEARKPKGLAIIAEFGGKAEIRDTKKKREVVITNEETGESKAYLIPYGSRIKVIDGQVLEAGDELTEGSVNPHDLLKIKGIRAVQDYMLREVQRVYRLQGALTVFLLVCGNSVSAVVLILIVWALVLLMGLVLTYWKRKRQMKKLLDMAEQLSERYLISEVMELPEQAEDQVYYQLLKMAGKSMLEQIGEVERERLEYKEYIEQWIHEIKTPITAMKLLCENHRMDWTKELLLSNT